MLRYLTAGESHGQALVVIVEGLPARLPITIEAIADELARRRLGYGRGPRMRFERDDVEFLSGVRHGRTLGSPVSILIRNTEWPKWVEEMSPAPGATAKPLRQPRPGHADLAGMQKYGFDDARDVLERASARETAARVAAGTLAKALLGRQRQARGQALDDDNEALAMGFTCGQEAEHCSPILLATPAGSAALLLPPVADGVAASTEVGE